MSVAAELVARLRRLDIRLSLDGERLNLSAPKGALTPELKAELAARKEDIKQWLREQEAAGALEPSIPRVPREGPLPLAHSQQRLWFLRQMNPGSTAYNVSGALRLNGRLDVDSLERAIGAVISRHESLRTRFVAVEGEPRCVIDPPAPFRLPRFDMSSAPADAREARALERVRLMARESFDLTKGPLVRAELIKLAAESHILCIVVDHIVSDGWSMGVFIREVSACYGAGLRGETAALPAPQTQFVDYAAWHRRWLDNGVLATQVPYWTQQLSGTLPPLQLPSERPRPAVQTYNGARLVSVLSAELAQSLKAMAREEGITFYMLLLAAFNVLMSRYTGEEDIILGSASANRTRPEIEGMIGFCANNIVMRSDLSGNPTVQELLKRVRNVALSAYSNRDVPFDVLVEVLKPRRELDRAPLFQVMFTMQPDMNYTLGGLDVRPLEFDPGTARLDLAVDVIEQDGELRVYYEYNTDLFDAAAIGRLAEHYRVLLEGLPGSRERRIRDLALVSPAETARITREWNPPATPYSSQSCVHQLFERQAALAPDAEAVKFESASLTYGELDRRANQLAVRLRERGAGPGTRVGIWLDRSLEMVVALLGVLKSGAAYVPLDPAFPRDRIDFMIRDAGLRLLVTQERLAASVSDEALQLLRMDTDRELIASAGADSLAPLAGPRDLAYVIYTSGSTGTPKGVGLEHRSVVNFLESMHREPGLSAQDRFVAVTTLSFDIAGLEIYGPLTCGGAVIIASRSTALDGERLMELIQQERATVIQATPATWRLLLEAGWSGSDGLRIFCGGEALPRELADRLLATGATLWNLYGPTETTIWSTVAQVTAGVEFPSIGRPIANTWVYVLDEEQRPVPVGVAGELYIGGDGVARGYLDRPDLTEQRFLPDPFSATSGARMYRTGDMARWRADGTLQCLGRVDHQVKIRGYRIEPGEIETVLSRHPDVAQAVVIARPDASGEHRLLAYLVARGAVTLEPATLRKYLGATLPEYMIPSVFMVLESLPLTPNGKIDRKALPAPDVRTIASGAGYVSPANPMETTVAEVWQEVLKLERVGRDDNFFDLGGHSLLVVQVQSRLRARTGCAVQLVDLFQHSTVASLAAFLAAGDSGEDAFQDLKARVARQIAARDAAHAPADRSAVSQES